VQPYLQPSQTGVSNTVVIDLAGEPRPTNYPDSHIDRYAKQAVNRFGESAVANCVRYILRMELTHRTAGVEAFSESNYTWGIKIVVPAGTYIDEFHQAQTSFL